ncbi:THAP domain-containing protein 1-like [Odontomachus brunneus]|uniref:THAP domain-containing protein 1-like n=1 Tax=Odontomachus brunneus TaxID=486640 RepID=UPI0013F2B226|nr:THAP domain-containing protein 1-like [Odontomachus brunneus]
MLCSWMQIWKRSALHKFPRDPERCSKWIESLKLDHLKNYASNEMQKNKVCHKHFCSEDYSPCLYKRVLLNVAVPVLFICDNVDTESNNMHHISQQQQSAIYVSEYAQYSQDAQCANNNHNTAITECEKLMDCSSVHQKACESSMPEQDKINSVLSNYGHRLQTLEIQMQTLKNKIKKRPQLQEITQSRNLSPIRMTFYKMNIKLKRRNKYLKRLVYNNKQQKKREHYLLYPVLQRKQTVLQLYEKISSE